MGSGLSLFGKTVATLEARRSQEMAALITRYGGVPYSAPALREEPLDNSPEIARFLDRLKAEPADLFIFLTGVGARTLIQSADSLGRQDELFDTLARALVIARGPKPVAVLRSYSLRIDMVPPEPNTSRELLELLKDTDLRGKIVALQHYGEPNDFLRTELHGRGARLVEVFLYRWALPENQEPVVRLIRDMAVGSVDVLAITSASQVDNLFKIAHDREMQAELAPAFDRLELVAAVGPVSAASLRQRGVRVDIVPEHPKMGHLIQAIAQALENRRGG